MPEVSVIIPTYNRAYCIENSIRSVLNQTFKDLELIIVDDGSTDNTCDIINSINDNRIRYIRQNNKGACAARNNGIKNATGKYLAFHDSDDIWHKDKLSEQIDAFRTYSPDIVICKMLRDNEIIPNKLRHGFLDSTCSLFSIGTQTIIAKKEVFKENAFDNMMPRFQDLEWMIRVKISGYSIFCVDKPLVDYSLSSDSISNNVNKLVKAVRIILNKYMEYKNELKKTFRDISSYLLYEASQFRNIDRTIYNELINLAFECYMNPKLWTKLLMVKSGLYNGYDRLKKRKL